MRLENIELQTGGLLIAGRKYRLANGRPAAGMVENIDSVAGGAADRARGRGLTRKFRTSWGSVPSMQAGARVPSFQMTVFTESADHTREDEGAALTQSQNGTEVPYMQARGEDCIQNLDVVGVPSIRARTRGKSLVKDFPLPSAVHAGECIALSDGLEWTRTGGRAGV